MLHHKFDNKVHTVVIIGGCTKLTLKMFVTKIFSQGPFFVGLLSEAHFFLAVIFKSNFFLKAYLKNEFDEQNIRTVKIGRT